MITIYDNCDLWEDYANQAISCLMDAGIYKPESERIWEVIAEYDLCDWNDVKRQLSDLFGDSSCIVAAKLGLWDGNRRVIKWSANFMNALYDAISGCDSFRLYDDGGHLHLEAIHHDGRNMYEFRRVTREGDIYLNNWRAGIRSNGKSKSYIVTNIFNNYSRLPRFAENVYGIRRGYSRA